MPYIGNKYEIGDHNNSWKPLDDISSYVATFDGSATNAVSTTNNTIRVPEHRFIQGQRVTYSNGGGGNIGGLTSGTAYYIIHDTNNEFKLATSLVNANNSTAINLSAVGSGTSHTVTAAFDGVNKKFKITYSGGRSSRFTSATQLTVAINNIVQRANDTATFTDGFGISDNEKIVFNVAPVAADIFWGNILSASLPTFDISDNKLDNFTGNGSTTDFTLSHIPANNESIIVTVNGVVQHPTDKNGTRAYSLDASVLAFTAAPANGDEIQVRHIGFAGATSGNVTGFYGRTGNVTLSSSADNAIVGVITATAFSGPFTGVGNSSIQAGILTVTKAHVGGGTTWGEDLVVTGNARVTGILTVGTNSVTITGNDVNITGVTTASNFKTGTSNLHSAGVEVAGVNVLGADTPIGLGATIYNSGAAVFTGIVTAAQLNVTGTSTFNDDSTFYGATSGRNIVWDKSADELKVKDNTKISFGTDRDLQLSHNNSDSVISHIGSATGALKILSGGAQSIECIKAGAVNISHNGNTKLTTTNTGVSITGGVTATTGTFSGNVSIGGTLTYEDVTNVDAVGLVTARTGIKITGGGLDSVGIVTVRSGGYLDVRTGSSINTNATGGSASGTLHKNTTSGEFAVVSGGTGGNNYLTFYTSASGAPTEKLRITSDAKIKVNVPASKVGITTGSLDVWGDATSYPTIRLGSLDLNEEGEHIRFGRKDISADIRYHSIWGRNSATSGSNYLAFKLHNGSGSPFTGQAEVLRILGDGKVGVNEASPDHMFHIKGTSADNNPVLAVESSSWASGKSAALRLSYTDGNAREIRGHYDHGFQFFLNQGEAMRIDTNNNVSIGSGAPVPSAAGYNRATLHLRQPNSGTSVGSQIKFTIQDLGHTAADGGIISYWGNKHFYYNNFETGGEHKFFITNGGVNGEALKISTAGELLINPGDSGVSADAGANEFSIEGGNLDIGMSFISPAANNRTQTIAFGDSANTIIGRIQYAHGDDSFRVDTGGSERLRINASGISVNGEVAASQNYPTIQPTLRLNFAAVKKLDPRITFYRTGPASYVDEYGNVRLVSANTPRFDHDPVTRESKGLLIEPNVANWIKYGTDLTGTGWGTNNVTHTLAPSVVGPDGKTGGVYESKENSSNAYHASHYQSSIPVTNNQYYTVSSWVKKGPNYRTDINGGNYQFYCSRGTGSVASMSIDSTFTSISAHTNTTSRSITQYPNGWVRVTYSFQSNSSTGNVIPHWLHGNGGQFVGNGASSVYIWGCQFEQLIYPTTYVPTNGTVVYRGQDDCVIDGDEFSDFYNTEESSLYVEGNIHVPTSYAGQYNIVHIGDSNADGHGIFRESGSKDVWYHMRSGNSTPSGGNLNPSGYGDWGDGQSEAKIAIAFKSGDQAISVNGGNQVTATVSSSYPSANISKMWIGSAGQGANNFSGTISRITYYPKQLTDSQLNTLTS